MVSMRGAARGALARTARGAPPRRTIWWMMPEPGRQKPMPNLAPAEARKSYTSLFCADAAARSLTEPCSAAMRWSQWIVVGACTLGRPEEMNCSTAICAVASCIATRSGRSLRYVCPRTGLVVASSRWPYRIFSDSVSGRFSVLRTTWGARGRGGGGAGVSAGAAARAGREEGAARHDAARGAAVARQPHLEVLVDLRVHLLNRRRALGVERADGRARRGARAGARRRLREGEGAGAGGGRGAASATRRRA